jgi:hypothetical protein
MGVHIPAVLVLFACKTVLAGPPDQNAAFTQHENREWETKHSMMVCRRHEIQLYDPAEGVQMGPEHTPVPPLNPNFAMTSQCARAGIRLAIDWDMSHRSTPWRVWRVGCPSPIVDRRTGAVIGYKLPECGHRDTVICEIDSVI